MDNDKKARTIMRNAGFLTVGRTLGDGFAFVMFVALTRAYGQEGIGEYSFAIAFTGFFAIPAGFGLYSLAIKELSRRPGSFRNDYGQIFSLHVILSTIASGLLLLILPFLPFDAESKRIIILIGAFQMMSGLTHGITAVFIAREDMYLVVLVEASLKAAATILTIGVIIAGGSLVVAVASLSAVSGMQLLFAYVLIVKKYGRPRLTKSISSLTTLVREALPYSQSTILDQFATRIDVVILGFILGASAAGVYNVGYRVVFMLLAVPSLIAFSILPMASRYYVDSKQELEELYDKSINSIIIVGLPISAGIWLIAPNAISLVFGEEYGESATVLRLLAGLLLLAFLSQMMGVFLMACDRQVDRTKGHWIAASTNVVGNLILIPTFGVKGAAIAALTSGLLLTLFFAIRLKPVLGWPRVSFRLTIGGLGVASFLIPFTLFPSTPFVVVIPASAMAYLLTLVLFNETRRNEVRLLLDMLKR